MKRAERIMGIVERLVMDKHERIAQLRRMQQEREAEKQAKAGSMAQRVSAEATTREEKIEGIIRTLEQLFGGSSRLTKHVVRGKHVTLFIDPHYKVHASDLDMIKKSHNVIEFDTYRNSIVIDIDDMYKATGIKEASSHRMHMTVKGGMHPVSQQEIKRSERLGNEPVYVPHKENNYPPTIYAYDIRNMPELMVKALDEIQDMFKGSGMEGIRVKDKQVTLMFPKDYKIDTSKLTALKNKHNVLVYDDRHGHLSVLIQDAPISTGVKESMAKRLIELIYGYIS